MAMERIDKGDISRALMNAGIRNSSNEWNPSGSDENESTPVSQPSAENELRLQIAREAVALVEGVYGTQSTPQAFEMRASAWAIALELMPVDLIMSVLRSEIQARTNQYPIVPADLLKRWKGPDDGRRGEGTYEVYQPPRPASLPERDTGGRAAWIAIGDKMRADQGRSGERAKLVRPEPRNAHEMSNALFDWCDMATWKNPPRIVTDFGAWMLTHVPDMNNWSPEVAREQWEAWQLDHGLDLITQWQLQKEDVDFKPTKPRR